MPAPADPVRLYSSVVSQGVSTVAYIPTASFLEMAGHAGERALLSAVRQRQIQVLSGKVHAQVLTGKLRKSIFSMPERLELKRKVCSTNRFETLLSHQIDSLSSFSAFSSRSTHSFPTHHPLLHYPDAGECSERPDPAHSHPSHWRLRLPGYLPARVREDVLCQGMYVTLAAITTKNAVSKRTETPRERS